MRFPIMLASLLVAAAVTAAPPLVPGGCTAPAAEHRDEAGCYLLSEIAIEGAPARLYWHIIEFPDAPAAGAEALKHRWSQTATAHGRVWLFVMGDKREVVNGGTPAKVIGPMDVPPGGAASIRFLISSFPPGMRTRVHSHPGSEAFYVVDGEQCVETPSDHHRIGPGDGYVVQRGIHMQAAAKGRRSLVALILRPHETWSKPEPGWKPTAYCDK
jgi:quercetin dioxygenase-like cupin family protein